MKLFLGLVVIIGFTIVSADLAEDEGDKLQMLIKELLGDEAGNLDLEAKDIEAQCIRATNNCNGLGRCVEGRWGTWYCRCDTNARVSGPQSTCVPKAKREEDDLEMEARDRLSLCNTETNNCNDNGVCRASRRFADQYICICDPGYKLDSSGSCVAQTKREMAFLDMSMRDTEQRCQLDTNNCNEVGECMEGRFGWKCMCDDFSIYTIDNSGSCVPRNPEENETKGLAKRLLTLLMSKQ